MTEFAVSNVNDSIRWYCNVLDMQLELDDRERSFAVVVGSSGQRLALKAEFPPTHGVKLHVQVLNLSQELNRLEAFGVHAIGEIKTSEEGYRRALLHDPDGITIVLFEWIPPFPTGAAMTPPDWPAGECVPDANPSPAERAELIAELESFPATLAAAVATMTDAQLERVYKKWTIRQIVHHLADSHINCFVRLKLTLTESNPTIKPYDETEWTKLADNRTMPISPSVAILMAVHARMIVILKSMTPEQFTRTYYHPEYKKTVTLNEMLGVYAHHGRHHLAQIEWVKANRAG